ncbi:PQQ-dependent sugar dehydrogenase [Synechococcus sp. J7-Johnson]|uniref:PQQ-dependent sugar dehydrogenase n=1 Tax=Synechococcus sp. J7-Johnson TaxID=2823737 RepID=UPI0020CC2C73|nr:PQQ-dependent sugar dehydrogenase [Synechococcus sp. J7-Johnson]
MTDLHPTQWPEAILTKLLLLAVLVLGVAPGCSWAKPEATATESELRRTVLVRGLEHPWGMAWLPNGDLLITERPGRLRLVREGVLDPRPISGLPPLLVLGQGGLLDVAVHPRFASNQLVYFTYAAGNAQANQTRVARARLVDHRLEELTMLHAVTPAKTGGQHFGSRLLWLPDGTLLVSVGDGGNPPIELEGKAIRLQAQNRGSGLGKILRLNDDGTIPADNPFRSDPGADPAVWSLGHRNIQGLAYDPLHRRIWASEHGARGGDELNLVVAAGNYGWPTVTHSREYSGPEITSLRSAPGLVDPRLVWMQAIAPSGLAVGSGRAVKSWKGNLFAGGLVSGDVRRIQLNPSGEVLRQTILPVGDRVRDVREGPDGHLHVLTDGAGDGALIRLEPAGSSTSP